MPTEIQKTQEIRLLDVFAIGPFFIYLAMNKKLSGWEKSLSFAFGLGTILYNANNYFEQQRMNQIP